jgi:hypothetical protein
LDGVFDTMLTSKSSKNHDSGSDGSGTERKPKKVKKMAKAKRAAAVPGEGPSAAGAAAAAGTAGQAPASSSSIGLASPVGPKSHAKLAKALAETEQASLFVNQMLRNLSSADTFSTVTAKAHEPLLAKATKSLTPANTSTLTADYDPSDPGSCKGMELIEQMRRWGRIPIRGFYANRVDEATKASPPEFVCLPAYLLASLLACLLARSLARFYFRHCFSMHYTGTCFSS